MSEPNDPDVGFFSEEKPDIQFECGTPLDEDLPCDEYCERWCRDYRECTSPYIKELYHIDLSGHVDTSFKQPSRTEAALVFALHRVADAIEHPITYIKPPKPLDFKRDCRGCTDGC